MSRIDVNRLSGQELRRGSKRHQFQIKIGALDELKDEQLRGEKMFINLEALSRDILRECELLEHQRLEEIQLHLLYLVNRRRAQVAANLHSVNYEISASRPSSRLSQRVNRLSAGSIRTIDGLQEPLSGDVYTNYLSSQHQHQHHSWMDRLIGSFLFELDAHLQRPHELGDGPRMAAPPCTLTDSQIEAIYGGQEERQLAISRIQAICREDSSFSSISSHRLLVCALLTALTTDSHAAGSGTTKLSILFCLIRYTMFSDVFLSLSGHGEPVIDVAKPILQQLHQHLSTHLANEPPATSRALSESDCFLINSLLIILMNLLRLSREEPRMVCPQLSPVLMNPVSVEPATDTASSAVSSLTLINLFAWLANKLHRDLRLLENIKPTVDLLSLTLRLLVQLSVFKEFLGQIRAQSDEQLIDSLVSLLNTVQVNRPQSSGGSPESSATTATNNHQLYSLELELMKLVNNLILDRQLKWRLMKRKLLLKCVLRSLAMFMASRTGQKSLIGHFAGSPVLIMPTRILYEMSCEPRMLSQLYRSKLIIKCLLEYLVSAVSESSKDGCESVSPSSDDARNYIVALWINLASRQEAPIYSDDLQLTELQSEYIHSAVRLIEKQAAGGTAIKLPVYIHSKLLRIVTQFIRNSANEAHSGWLKSLASSVDDLVELVRRRSGDESVAATECYGHCLLVECVACLSNLINNSLESKRVPLMADLVKKLFELLFSDSKEPQSDSDDLLLVCIVLVGNLARCAEICCRQDGQQQVAAAPLFWQPFQATCNALKSQPIDREMLICALYALQQLLRHRGFLDQIWPSGLVQPTLDSPALLTSRKLASLLLNGDKQLSRLSVSVLEQINQLELARTQQETELVRLTRFEAYNEKWLSTIQASRRQDLGSSSLDLLSSPMRDYRAEEEEEEEEDGEEDDYELSHLRALALESGQAAERADNHYDHDDDDESDFEASGQEEPDMNVIDANSMIKHLTARRELRFTRDSV